MRKDSAVCELAKQKSKDNVTIQKVCTLAVQTVRKWFRSEKSPSALRKARPLEKPIFMQFRIVTVKVLNSYNYAKFQGVEVSREGMKTVKVGLFVKI